MPIDVVVRTLTPHEGSVEEGKTAKYGGYCNEDFFNYIHVCRCNYTYKFPRKSYVYEATTNVLSLIFGPGQALFGAKLHACVL